MAVWQEPCFIVIIFHTQDIFYLRLELSFIIFYAWDIRFQIQTQFYHIPCLQSSLFLSCSILKIFFFSNWNTLSFHISCTRFSKFFIFHVFLFEFSSHHNIKPMFNFMKLTKVLTMCLERGAFGSIHQITKRN